MFPLDHRSWLIIFSFYTFLCILFLAITRRNTIKKIYVEGGKILTELDEVLELAMKYFMGPHRSPYTHAFIFRAKYMFYWLLYIHVWVWPFACNQSGWTTSWASLPVGLGSRWLIELRCSSSLLVSMQPPGKQTQASLIDHEIEYVEHK